MKGFVVGILVGLVIGVAASFVFGKFNLFQSQNFVDLPIDPKKGGDTIGNIEGYELTKNHRGKGNGQNDRKENGRSYYFTKDFLLNTMLKSNKVMGLNFYSGLKKNSDKEAFLLVVGVDESGHDILPPDGSAANKIDYPIGITYMKCPNNCDNNSLMLKD